MRQSLKEHKKEVELHKKAYQDQLKSQFSHTKTNTVNVSKLALLGGAGAYIVILVLGKIFGALTPSKKKKRKQEQTPKVVYIDKPLTKKDAKLIAKVQKPKAQNPIFAALKPIVIGIIKTEGTKLAQSFIQQMVDSKKK